MTAMRPETTSEHIARDMREGRFPERSEPQMVADPAATAPERIWTASTNGKCHVGFDAPSLNYTNEYVRADLAAVQPAHVHPDPRDEVIGLPEITEEMITAGRNAADDYYFKWRGLGARKEGEGLDGMHFIVREALRAALAAAKAVQHG